MDTPKYKQLKLSFSSPNSSNPLENLLNTPKLSIKSIELKSLKENNKINELKLPSINCIFSPEKSTNENSNNSREIKPIIELKKHNFKNSIFKQLQKNESDLKKLFGNRFNKFSKEKDEFNKSLKNCSSTSSIYYKNLRKYKLQSDLTFHRNLMAFNNEKLNYSRNNEQKQTEDEYLKNIAEDPSKKQPKTGIFGPRNNIINIIRAEMERLKYDNIYRGVEEGLKELIKDEIMDAQVKLKRKPENLLFNKKLERPLYLKKLDKYKYISSMNKIRELNQIANVSVVEEDGNIMKRLANDAYDALMHKRGNNQ